MGFGGVPAAGPVGSGVSAPQLDGDNPSAFASSAAVKAEASSVVVDVTSPDLPIESTSAGDDIFVESGVDPVEMALLDDIFSGYAAELGMKQQTAEPSDGKPKQASVSASGNAAVEDEPP